MARTNLEYIANSSSRAATRQQSLPGTYTPASSRLIKPFRPRAERDQVCSSNAAARTVCIDTVSVNTVRINTICINTVSRHTVVWYIPSVIRQRLNDLLQVRSRTRYWLARETGISEGNLGKLAHEETTSIEFNTLERICRALACNPGDLLEIVDDEKPAMRSGDKRGAKKKGAKRHH
jgi:putative transcriptional regulator